MLKTVRDINTKNQREFKSYLKRTLSGVKMGESSRKGYHIRFALDPSQFDTYFKKYNLEIVDYPGPSISDKFETYVLIATADLGSNVPYGTMIPYVNNYIGAAKIFGYENI